MCSVESILSEKQPKWCHLVISNPLESLLTKPNLRALADIAFEHVLHDDLLDFAYSAMILAFEVGGIALLGFWRVEQRLECFVILKKKRQEFLLLEVRAVQYWASIEKLGPYRKSLSQRAISLNFFPPVYRSRASELLIVYYIIL